MATLNINRVDQSTDESNEQLVKLAQVYSLPDYVLATPVDELKNPPEKNANWYADTRGTFQFPCHSKAACVVSHLFFLEKQAEINPKVRAAIQERLIKFATHWRVADVCQKLAAAHAAANQQSTAWPDSVYALVQYRETKSAREKVRQYPLRNTLEVKRASEWFAEQLPELREQFTFRDRQKIAGKILNRAEELGALLSPEHEEVLQKCAGHGLNSPGAIGEGLEYRAQLLGGATGQILTKLAETVRNKPKAFLDPATTTDLGDTLDRLDRENGFLNKYSSELEAPEDLVFGITYKRANAAVADACQTLTGSIYSRRDFEKLSWNDVADAFGQDLAKQVSNGLRVDPVKMAELASTLPLGDARMLDDLLGSLGVQPLAKEAHKYGLTPDEYEAIMNATE